MKQKQPSCVSTQLNVPLVCFESCSLQDEVAADFTSLTKTLYDLHKVQEPRGCEGSPLAQLVVDNFDEEQIWQELELQNNAVLTHFKHEIDAALSNEMLTVLVEEEEEEVEEEEEEEPKSDNNLDEEEEETSENPEVGAQHSTDEDSDLDFDVGALEKREKQKKALSGKGSRARGVPSEVDDRFFKLSEMESFLDDMDKQEGKENEEEHEIDYFRDLPSDEDDELDLETISNKQQKKHTVCIFSCFQNKSIHSFCT